MLRWSLAQCLASLIVESGGKKFLRVNLIDGTRVALLSGKLRADRLQGTLCTTEDLPAYHIPFRETASK